MIESRPSAARRTVGLLALALMIVAPSLVHAEEDAPTRKLERGELAAQAFLRALAAEDRATIEAIANKGHIGLIENFAEQIADCALTNAMVKRCRIYIQKPDVFSNLDSVGVELTKERV